VHCCFTSDLHGHTGRYKRLLRFLAAEEPDALFLGGDLFAHYAIPECPFTQLLLPHLRECHASPSRPLRCFVILGNDDAQVMESVILDADAEGILDYVHLRTRPLGDYFVSGCAFIPPTPFLLKDWERYDVSRYVDPGCVSPEEGRRSVAIAQREIRHTTIATYLETLRANAPVARTLFLFHAPPYGSHLDRADLDDKVFDHVPLDVHIGSIAIQRFIAEHQPPVTLHGHAHASPRLTGHWSQVFGRTHAFSGCHDGPGLALVHFDPADPGRASREILAT
jgi:Icc-related predicted phosphoesterase